MMLLLSIVLYPNLSLIFLIFAALFGTLYTIKGKYVAWAYDITPSIGAALLVYYGATTIGGITPITTVAAICAFFISVYSEWIDGMKDVDTDKKFNIPTTAVRWGYTHDKPLSISLLRKQKEKNAPYRIGDPNLLYFIGIVIAIDVVYSVPFFYGLLSPIYFYIFLTIGIPVQAFLIYKLFGKQDKESLRKHPLFFLGSMMFLAFVLVIDKIAIWGVIVILAFIVGWVYTFSLFGVRFSHN
jgi:4-hydroxybenzoate polyprenyltransferase